MRSLLFVDDDPGIRAVFQDAVEGLPIRLTLAAGPIEALRRIEAAPPDLLLTDYRMPRMTGLDLVDRARASHPNLRCAIYTSLRRSELPVREDVLFFSKATRLAELRAALERWALAR